MFDMNFLKKLNPNIIGSKEEKIFIGQKVDLKWLKLSAGEDLDYALLFP